jgi:hypothetical protein
MNDGELYPGGARNGCGFLNIKGEWAIDPQFEWAGNFCGQRAWAKLDDTQYVYLRPDGSTLHTPLLDDASDFHCGLARARSNGTFLLIDSEGQVFWSE